MQKTFGKCQNKLDKDIFYSVSFTLTSDVPSYF